ncbi:hypothetical protein ACP4OV_022127 [Aristida adscensionis]
MDGGGGGGESAAEGASAGFVWDADSQLYYHASTGFYHDPVAGWYYSSRDGQYYIYENGNYVPLTTGLGNESKDEANQDIPESSLAGWEEGETCMARVSKDYIWLKKKCVYCRNDAIVVLRLIAGLEPAISTGEETLEPPSEWMEETLINLYLSGYSNREASAETSHGNTGTNDRSEPGSELGNLTSGSATTSLGDATLQQAEDETETKNTSVHESLGEEEEKWLSQYGQVERVNDDLPMPPSIDLWDWDMVKNHVNKGLPVTRLVGCLSRGSSQLHPSLPTRGGLLKTAPVREVHLDLVRVSTGKLYRLRNPSRKYLSSLSAYDSSNPTKDWGFPDIHANLDISLHKQSSAQCESDVAEESSIEGVVSAASGKEQKTKVYRDRAAERRNLHRGLGIGPGQKQNNIVGFDEYDESNEHMDTMDAASMEMTFNSSGLHSAKRMMENMGWKEGEPLGRSGKGIVEPIQPTINKHGAGLGWSQIR